MKNMQKGFSLVELMIVVAIIGVLAAVAVPAYTNYTTRAKVSTAIALAGAAKTAIAEYYNTNGSWPTDNTTVNMGAADGTGITTDYVAKVAIASNVITVTFKGAAPVPSDIRGDNFTMTGTANNGVMTWACASPADNTGVKASFCPSSCACAGT